MEKKLIHETIQSLAQKTPSAIAVEEGPRAITYAQINQNSEHVAQIIKNTKVDVVGIFMPNSIEYITSIISIMKSGNTFLPIEISCPIKRLKIILEKVKPGIIITNCEYADKLNVQLKELNLFNYIRILILKPIDHSEAISLEESQLVYAKNNNNGKFSAQNFPTAKSNYIMFTSGSTGVPKAIEGSHKGLRHFIDWEIEEFEINCKVRVAQLSPISFDVSLRDIFVPLLAGGTCCIPKRDILLTPKRLLNWIIESKISILHCIPSVFRLLIKEIETNKKLLPKLGNLKKILLAGEPLLGKDVINWMNLIGNKVELVNLYGPSETTLAKFFHRILKKPEDKNKIIPVGLPLPDTSYYVVNGEKVCGPNEIGEIYIKTSYRSNGYFNDNELTKKCFIDDPFSNDGSVIYKTGDFGRYEADATLEVLGRKDRQIKMNGIRVELGEVEQQIRSIDGVDEVQVVVDKRNIEALKIICYYTVQKSVTSQDIRNILKQNLAENFIPSIFVKLKAFPRLINGKIDLNALAKTERFMNFEDVDVKTENPIELKLLDIWKKCLGTKSISLNSLFFEIGGSSLQAVKVIGEIYRTFNIEISIQVFYGQSSIRKIAQIIEKHNENYTEKYSAIQKVRKQDYYPLSSAQERIWISEYLMDNGKQYNITDAYTLSEELDVGLLQESLNHVISRHETLRTSIQIINGKPQQLISDNIINNFNVVNLSNSENKHQKIRDIIKEDTAKKFDLKYAPLFRLKLFKIHDLEHVFYLNFHHIISDGWSIGNFFAEIFEYYNQKKSGNTIKPSELPIHYKDYVNWCSDIQKTDKFQKSEKYWLQRLSGDLPELNLKTDFTRPEEKNYSGSSYQIELDKNLSNDLKFLARKNDTTLFVVLMAIYNVLLSQNSEQQDIVIGFPVSGREHPDLHNLIGMFVNTLATRNKCEGSLSFQTFLSQVKNNINKDIENQIYPFNSLVKNIQSKRNVNRYPIFDVMLVLQNFDETNINTIKYERFDIQHDITWLDLIFNCVEVNGVIKIKIIFDDNLFKAETIKELAKQFVKLSENITKDPSLSVSDHIDKLKTE